jgi:hypothetical protein
LVGKELSRISTALLDKQRVDEAIGDGQFLRADASSRRLSTR